MLLKDIINHTKTVLPLFTDKFATNVDIISITKVGNIVTVNTIAHGLSVGNEINITGVKTLIPITNITTASGVATATCSVNHDLTPGFTLSVEIESTQAEYNGVFTLGGVNDRKIFRFNVVGSPPVGTGTLKTFHNIGFNGPHIVTEVVDADNFRFVLDDPNLTAGTGDNMLVQKNIRISGGALTQRFIDTYTKQEEGDLWGFFQLDDMVTSSDRTINNDSKNERKIGEDFKLTLIQDMHFYVFINVKEEVSARAGIDLAQELARPIYKTLAALIPDNVFTTEQETILMPASHGIESYEIPLLVYRYSFQFTTYMLAGGCGDDQVEFMANTGDTLPNFKTRAFLDFKWDIRNEFDVAVKVDEFEVPQSKE